MKQVAWITIGVAILVQLFFDFGVAPGMASAEGVAAFLPISKSVQAFSYHCCPYLLFSLALLACGKRTSLAVPAVCAGAIIAVLSPIFAMNMAAAFEISGQEFREGFWPIRPLVQIIAFLFVSPGAYVMSTGVGFALKQAGFRAWPSFAVPNPDQP